MMNLSKEINILGSFCGMRDVSELTQAALQAKYGFKQADVFVLFGGSILCGGDLLADAIEKQVAKHYIIVGGAGHTTQSLRDRMQMEYPDMDTAGKPEAYLFSEYIYRKYGLRPEYIETESTNCGNNITYLLKLLAEHQISCERIILSQDATMQRRMSATLQNYKEDWTIINYATYQANVVYEKEQLAFADAIYGMWGIERYVNLLMGEIPRLTDNVEGYGPKGKGFIAHVDVPAEVQQAFETLCKVYAVREANPLYASK